MPRKRRYHVYVIIIIIIIIITRVGRGGEVALLPRARKVCHRRSRARKGPINKRTAAAAGPFSISRLQHPASSLPSVRCGASRKFSPGFRRCSARLKTRRPKSSANPFRRTSEIRAVQTREAYGLGGGDGGGA